MKYIPKYLDYVAMATTVQGGPNIGTF